MRNFWILFLLALTSHFIPASADEGMWTLNGFPTAKVEKKYGFRATPEWLEKVRLASARLAGGCSGSFVSPHGLVMTNHHCAHECIEDLSTSGRDYVAEGFFAKEGSDEHRCPTVEINRLVEITDVTKRIQGATKGLSGAPFNDAQKAEMSKTEKECSGESDRIRCEVVTLYNGGKFDLYRYQRYQDVRLVFAPEKDIAFFGGDPDNFMFPRFDLDVSFLRVYEDGKPLSSADYFSWSRKPINDGDLTFVTGHPGRTSRLSTIAELEYQRDVRLIQTLIQGSELRGVLTEFGNRSPEAKRVSEGKLFGLENSLKATRGKLGALTDREFFAKKKANEANFRKKISSKPEWKKTYGSIWDETEGAVKKLRSMYFPYAHLEQNRFLNSKF